MVLKYSVLFFCMIGLSVGHILLKFSVDSLKSSESIYLLILNPYFLAAMTLFGSLLLLWLWCLQGVSLSKVYFFTALPFVMVPFLSWMIFNEELTKQYYLSAALIVSGILCSML